MASDTGATSPMEVVAEGDPTWNVLDDAEECGLSDDMVGMSLSPPAVACVPYASHAPSTGRRHLSKYWLFHSASDGCLACVKYYVEVEKVDPASTSNNCKYSVRDFADHARKMNVAGAQAVLDYLNSAVPQGCSPGKKPHATSIEGPSAEIFPVPRGERRLQNLCCLLP